MTTPYLKAQHLAGAGQALMELSTAHPLLSLFEREVYDGTTIEVPISLGRVLAADPVHPDEPTPQGDEHDIEVILASPEFFRWGRALKNSEISFFRMIGELQKVKTLTTTQQQKLQRAVTKLARETMMPVVERIHAMEAQALQGTVTLKIGGQAQTHSYGLTSLTQPGTTWSNAGASVLSDIYDAQDEFEDNCNVRPNVAICNKRMFSNYLASNTAFNAAVNANPELAKAFAGFNPTGEIGAMKAPTQPFRWMDMLWVPVTGTFVDTDGATNNRWNPEIITLAALDTDEEKVLEWGAVRDAYSPEGLPAFDVYESQDPKAYNARYADNGVPIVRHRRRVQTWDVVV
ncbi:MAG: major capsid protein [Gemmatimonadota bacterium]